MTDLLNLWLLLFIVITAVGSPLSGIHMGSENGFFFGVLASAVVAMTGFIIGYLPIYLWRKNII